MTRAAMVVASFSCLILLGAPGARAQGQSASQAKLYMYVAEWGVPRAQWNEMAKFQMDDRAEMDKLVDDGTITGYGEGAFEVHSAGGMTHFNWFQASSIGGILRALSAVSSSAAGSPVLAAAKHADFFLQSTMYGGKSGTHTDGYVWVGHFQLQPGKAGDWIEMFGKFVRPILDRMVADGTIVSYELDTPLIHTPGSSDTLDYSFVTAGPDGIDKFFAEVAKGEAANSFIPTAISSVEVPAGHYDLIGKVTVMRSK